jgi:putative alpha-1,2-mannosidase
MSALGFYPLDPTSGEYVIGSPLVRSAKLRIGAPYAPAEFKIVAHNQSRENARVVSVKLNGQELANRRLKHADIVRGGVLEFEMSK